jgi:SAM-dependent methyltransferase
VTRACRACGATGLELFYRQSAIPANSCLLLDDRAAALAFPKGALELAFCPTCGFIQNDSFAPELTTYSAAYEESQAFSPRFLRFVDELIDRLDAQGSLAGRHVLEIGCGKGDFLVRLAERTGASGTGIDPAFRPERIASPAASRLTFLAETYGEQHAGLAADLVCCRHTLEHIADVQGFLTLLRRNIGEGRTRLFLEVPDTTRILREAAFWDVYYEHCSYFTAGSLARLLRRTGFAVTELRLGYEGQYLLLEAVPSSVPAIGTDRGEPLAAEETPAATAALVAGFRERVGAELARLRGQLDDWRARGLRVVLWGSGSKATACLTSLAAGPEVLGVIDINPHKAGRFVAGTGHRIAPPEELPELAPDVVVVMNPVYAEEIRADLAGRGLAPELVCLA